MESGITAVRHSHGGPPTDGHSRTVPWKYSVAVCALLTCTERVILTAIALIDGDVKARGVPGWSPGGFWGALIQPFLQGDGLAYQAIAQHGYTATGPGNAFFPLWPGLLAGGHALTRLPVADVGWILAIVTCLAAFTVTHQLVAGSFGRRIATLTVLFMLLSPSGFFFFAPLTESLFLLLSASAFLAMRTHRRTIAHLSTVASALSRAQGVFLGIPLAAGYWKQRRWLSMVTILAASVSGFLIVQITLTAMGVDGGILGAETWYGQRFSMPWAVIIDSIHSVSAGRPDEAANLVALMISFLLIPYAWPRLSLEWNVYIWVSVVPMLFRETATTPLMGFSRYVAVVFPLFVVVAHVLERRTVLTVVALAISSVLLVLRFLAFAHGQYVA